jgi:DNA-binding PadR family transcriptional regulator
VRRKTGSLVPLESAILAAAADLRKHRVEEFHGYQIAKHLVDVADRRLLTAYGTLYRALGRLEKMGLLASRWEDPQIAADANRPVRRLYSLTGAGVAAESIVKARTASPLLKPGRRKVARA